MQPTSKVIAYGLRQTAGGRFSVIRVATHTDRDMRGGELVIVRRRTTHTGLPGSIVAESVAEGRARALAARDGVQYVGFRADSI